MMSKLLSWNDTLFLVRCELGKLQIERVGVDIEKKKVLLHCCNTIGQNKAITLPVDARLVAANEVDDLISATRYPVLVFLSLQEPPQNSFTSSKCRQTIKNATIAVSSNNAVIKSASTWLLFYTLYQSDNVDEIQLRFINMIKVSIQVGNKDSAVGRKNINMLQGFVMDGPHMLIYHYCSQHLMLLHLQRAIHGGDSLTFIEPLNVVHGIKDDTLEAFQVVSCTYVSELHSARPHILIHTLRQLPFSSSDTHTWSVVDLDYSKDEFISMKQASLCQYLPVFSSTTEGIETTAKLEQITCCCFIFEPTQKDFAASSSCDTDAFTSWGRTLRIRSAQTSVGVSTLVVTGTTSNTIYVHANEILLVSYVLSAQPAEIRSLCEDNSDHRHVLFVRCEDENRSFFILKFSSQGEHLSMELLLCAFLGHGLCAIAEKFPDLTYAGAILIAFEHVGYAQIGYFSGTHVSDRSNQILLLNDVRGMFDIGDTMDIIGNEGGMHKFLDHKQLVKRSVLVVQKTLLPVIKLSCHRLRLHEVKKTKHGSRLCKRTRNNDSVSLDDTKAGTFCYIERIQKASSRDIIANHIEPVQDDAGGNGAASRAQLEKLANSFSARLSNGLQGLERLQIIVRDKVSLVYQLNQHIARLWQKIQASASYPNEHLVLLPFSAQEVDNRGMDFQVHVDMETIVCSTTDFRNDAEDETMMPARTSFSDDLKLKKQVLLEQLTLLEYVPSSSHVHAEVVLRNLSDFVFYDCYVFLTARNGRQTPAQGWRCLSSVVPEFCPARDMIKHTIRQQKESRFQLSFHFATSDPFLRERRPLEVMLWLHLRPSEDDSVFKTTLACNPSELALAIASVNIYLYDLIGISRGLRTPFRSNESGDLSTLQEQTQLLFISSGSNLVSWLRKIISELPTCTDFIIGRTLALISISVKSRVGVLYDINRIVASLPPDVHVMHNPFQHAYLRALQRVLCSMRQEILTIRHQGVHDTEKMDEMYGAGKNYKDRTQNAEDCDPASFYRMVQCNTDLYANRWLQKLQKRVDFQLIWIDAGTNDL